MLLPALGRAREAARRTQAGSNMRQMLIGFTMYSNDHRSMLPVSCWYYYPKNAPAHMFESHGPGCSGGSVCAMGCINIVYDLGDVARMYSFDAATAHPVTGSVSWGNPGNNRHMTYGPWTYLPGFHNGDPIWYRCKGNYTPFTGAYLQRRPSAPPDGYWAARKMILNMPPMGPMKMSKSTADHVMLGEINMHEEAGCDSYGVYLKRGALVNGPADNPSNRMYKVADWHNEPEFAGMHSGHYDGHVRWVNGSDLYADKPWGPIIYWGNTWAMWTVPQPENEKVYGLYAP